MNTSEIPYRGSKRKKLSNADIKSYETRRKPVLNPEEIFADIETPEERAMRIRLEKRAVEEARLREETLNHEFIAGRRYFIGEEGKYKTIYKADFTFIYQGKQGRHHMFRHAQGKWSRTYTDPQLIGKIIKEF